MNRYLRKSLYGAAMICLAMILHSCSPTLWGTAKGDGGALLLESNYDYSKAVSNFVPGDGLRITIYPDSAHFLNGIYPIDLGGYVYLPLVGRFLVTDMTTAQFSDFLQNTFAPYLRFPEVQVTALIRVSMLGGFKEAGLYYIEPDRSFWELVYMAGGPEHEDGLRKMKWERDKMVVASNLIPHYQSGHSLAALGIKSGDRISTPQDPTRNFWSGLLRDTLIRDVLPVATFLLSVFVMMK